MKLANVISSQIANLFQKRGEVRPTELIKALEREVAKQKTKDNLVPNAYTIFLCEDDCHRLSAARLMKALHEAALRKVIREDSFMDGALTIKIEKNSADDAITIAADYVAESAQEEDTIDLANNVLSHTLIEDAGSTDDAETIVADKTKILSTMRTSSPRRIEYDLAVITDSESREIVFGERQIFIGRKNTNDFVLDDDSVSRIHAYIAYERHRHVLYDAGSLNGTFVNRKSVSRHELRDGDKIFIGSTTLTYKVL